MVTATEALLEEFPPVSTDTWLAAIARDLKGADDERKLLRRSDEGLQIKPFYRADDLTGQASVGAAPGGFPYRRGVRATGDWQIREEIDATDLESANREACAALAAGADEIAFTRIRVSTPGELELLLRNLDKVPVHLEQADEGAIRLLMERAGSQRNTARVSTGSDAFGNLAYAAGTIAKSPAGFVPFTIHGEQLEEAGATAAEEVGFALAAGVDFLAAMEAREIAPERAAAAIGFSFAMGANYFFQMAKLRGFRMAWARAAENFGIPREAAVAHIAVRTSRWNKTVYDPHVNILRATTETMAAVLGGADSVTVAPFDECYEASNKASRRLARNTQLLLKHEAWLGRVADAGGGSYYLETLTDSLAHEGWTTLQQIESRGGFRQARADGAIAGTLERSMAARQKAVLSRRRALVGTNQFVNPAERAMGSIDEQCMSHGPRAAEAFEQLRLRTEKHVAAGGKMPCVLLAEIGDMKMRSARANFGANFFACAGFEIVTRRFKTAAEIAEAPGDLIVLCSADQEYRALAADLIPRLKGLGRETPVIIAGNPEGSEQLAAAGIAGFIHLRGDAVEVLTNWQERLGIKG